MKPEVDFKGSRWFKCDFHLHTTASKCFQNQEVTPEEWVASALKQGLDCVAVTDHNTDKGIDAIKAAAVGKNLIVFPGVEITCDTTKVHLLILFDVNRTSQDIADFIIRCGINRNVFGEQDASTSKSIFEVSKIAHEAGAIVIPAHIDEYNGLGSISLANLEKFYELDFINAVQVVHGQFLDKTPKLETLKPLLSKCYNKDIDIDTIKSWYKPVQCAQKHQLAIVTFSDNPHEPCNPKHGIAGIGTRYTWIKMDESPSLEGLRQAFLLPDLRVKPDFISTSKNAPYKFPELWIKSINISGTTVIDQEALIVEFSPQLTTIIGGRGSGKSSIIRFIRGVFNKIIGLEKLQDILNDHHDFYKREDAKTKKGVLKEQSKIVVEFIRDSILYRITASNIHKSNSQDVKIEKYDSANKNWLIVKEEGFIDFFEFDHYSQKQIYEMAQEQNSIRDRIDDAIEGMENVKKQRDSIKRECLEKATRIRNYEQLIIGKVKLQTEINDINERIQKIEKSGIAELIGPRGSFTKQANIVDSYLKNIQQKVQAFDSVMHELVTEGLDYSKFDNLYQSELLDAGQHIVTGFQAAIEDVNKIKMNVVNLISIFETLIENSKWRADYNQNRSEFEMKKTGLESQGISEIANFEKLTNLKDEKEKSLANIMQQEHTLQKERDALKELKEEHIGKCKEITSKRRKFVSQILQGENVRIRVNPFRNKTDFAYKLRSILQRDEQFAKDITTIVDICFKGPVEEQIIEVRNIFRKIRNGEPVKDIGGSFENFVKNLSESQLDEIELLLPEDEIEVQYKHAGANNFESLSSASAGQKTTAILTFILSYGNKPLILDQPEDDLDNKLVYELIVERLKKTKEYRQLIIVTHNANIPVNADAEYIISMDSKSKKMKVLHTGTVERTPVMKEICDVMEGGQIAFKMRSNRYKHMSES